MREDPTKIKCSNCGGQHSAKFRGCSGFQTVKAVLRTTATTGKSYAEAAKAYKTVEGATHSVTQHAENTTTSTTTGAYITAIKNAIMTEVTAIIEEAIG